MSYIFLQEQGEESSVDNYSDIPLYVLSSLRSTQDKFCCSDNETECCPSFQSGTMSAPLTESPGEEQLMLFAEDSPAKTSVRQEKEPELEETVRDYGKNMHELLTRYGLSLSSRKTPRFCGLVALTLSSETCPTWGMMQDGACWELGTSARHIKETGCGSWLKYGTPTARMQPRSKRWATGLPNPAEIARREALGGTQTRQKYATPQSRDFRTGSRDRWENPERSRNLNDQLATRETGQLNPSWVEWLMGWPVGWTDLKPLETGRFQQWQQQHGEF